MLTSTNNEAKARGELVYIHDVIGPSRADYDVLISDIKHETLNTRISEEIGLAYLSEATEADAKTKVTTIEAYIHGSGYRPLVAFIVGHKGEFRWVFFIIDSSSPLHLHFFPGECV